jgi:hypothetical protein
MWHSTFRSDKGFNHLRVWLIVVAWGYGVPARAQMPAVRELHPDLTITFSELLPTPYNQMYSHAFIVREDGLTALLFSSNRASQPHQALATFDRSGSLKHIVPVTCGQLDSDWLQIGPNGTVLGRAYGPRGAESIVTINAAGDPTPILPFNEPLLDIAMNGSTAVSVSVAGARRIDTATGHITALSWQGPRSQHIRVSALPNGRVAVLDRATATIQMIGETTAPEKWTLATPDISDIERRLANNPSRDRALLIDGMAAGPSGDLYILLSFARVAEGVNVLHVNGAGVVVDRLRCGLPVVEAFKTAGNPAGFVLPYAIAVDGGNLYLLGSRGAVIRYSLQ